MPRAESQRQVGVVGARRRAPRPHRPSGSAQVRRWRRRWSVRRLVPLVVLAVLLARLSCAVVRDIEADPAVRPLVAGPGRIVAVLDDGRLAWLPDVADERGKAGGPAKVRLLGVRIDDPRGAVPWLRNSAAGRRARLEFDRRRLDDDHAWLAYVYVDEQLLNEQLLAAGWGTCSGYPGDSATYHRRLQRAEAEARRRRRGHWSGGEPELVRSYQRG